METILDANHACQLSASQPRTSLPPLVTDAAHLTPAWIESVLRYRGLLDAGTVADVRIMPVGNGMLGSNLRLELQYSGASSSAPRTLVAKLPATNSVSRETGARSRLYLREIRFYQEIAPFVDVGLPNVLYADISEDMRDFCLLFEDLAPAVGGDQLQGCTVEQAMHALDAAAALHGPQWGKAELATHVWLDRNMHVPGYAKHYAKCVQAFAERYAGQLEGEVIDAALHLGKRIDAYFAMQQAPWTITHGDFRLDNMLFDAKGGRLPVAVLDWQTVQLGPGMTDVSYFLGSGLTTALRREHERDLVQRYHQSLSRYGVDYDASQCWRDYGLFAPQGLIQAVIAAILTTRTERGDLLFLTMARRHGIQMLDLGTLDLVA
ncbi:phosphotransferase [Burkholderia sp. D-99]|uniref:phosphotransferase n=1 Tax=Burkholderia sp. D-99 TaxID=2717316 RepID=UPI001421CE87|nr:phosphotransferase [Burkholderia sp. D-99]NHV25875.1 phosphotransferase [Burkholderia sp. D-99]